MINALRKELSVAFIDGLIKSEIIDELKGITDIIFDEYLDGIPEGTVAGEYYRDNSNYQILTSIVVDLRLALDKF